MKPDEWAKLRHFSPNENWGDPSRMDADFLFKLDDFRAFVDRPFALTTPAFATSGHSPNSYHYKGRAVDGRFLDHKNRPLSLANQIILALMSPFNGIGIYTWWANGPGLHLDDRKTKHRVMWLSFEPNSYKPFDERNLKKLFKLL